MSPWIVLSVALIHAVSSQTATSAPEEKPAHIHLRHVVESINGTPGNVGLLTILEEEAEIAARHAGLAVSDLSDLESIKTHVGHVRHAIDPETEPEGPGKGYGVSKAANGVKTHVNLATRSEGASENIERHAAHVISCAENIASWSETILSESEKVVNAESAEEVAPAAQRIEELTRHILEGTDADGDGSVSWQQGEGGLAQAQRHIQLMLEGEGMTISSDAR